MPTLQTVAIASSTHNNTTPPITLIQTHTPADKLIRDAIYTEKKAVSL
jgi:aminoglycoside phosphotransferase family enzyme